MTTVARGRERRRRRPHFGHHLLGRIDSETWHLGQSHHGIVVTQQCLSHASVQDLYLMLDELQPDQK
jgi:hypothetical protein